MIIKGVVSLVALTLGVVLTGEILWGAVALAASWALVMLLYDLPNAAFVLKGASRDATSGGGESHLYVLRPNWDFRKLTQLAWLSLPLGIVMLLISLNANIRVTLLNSTTVRMILAFLPRSRIS